MNKAEVGLIGIVGTGSRQDFWGAMGRIAALGCRGIEAPGGLHGGEDLKRFQALGLQALTVSADLAGLRDNLGGILAEAEAVQSPRVPVWRGAVRQPGAAFAGRRSVQRRRGAAGGGRDNAVLPQPRARVPDSL